MSNVYVVSSVPVRDERGVVAGWVRADVLADGTLPSDVVFLRDGSVCSQTEAVKRIAENPGLLYPTRAEVVRDGLARLREASHADGAAPTRRTPRRGA